MMYYNNLNVMWDELRMLLPNTVCICITGGACKCGAVKNLTASNENDKLMQFL